MVKDKGWPGNEERGFSVISVTFLLFMDEVALYPVINVAFSSIFAVKVSRLELYGHWEHIPAGLSVDSDGRRTKIARELKRHNVFPLTAFVDAQDDAAECGRRPGGRSPCRGRLGRSK